MIDEDILDSGDEPVIFSLMNGVKLIVVAGLAMLGLYHGEFFLEYDGVDA